MSKGNVTMSDVAKELGVSRAYISMVASGKRKPGKDFVNKLESLGVTLKLNVNNSDTNAPTLNQQVQSSRLWWLTTYGHDPFGTPQELSPLSQVTLSAAATSIV